jgi:hypothetical protein
MPDEPNHQRGWAVMPDSVADELAEIRDRLHRLELSYKAVYDLLTDISKVYDKPPAGEVQS